MKKILVLILIATLFAGCKTVTKTTDDKSTWDMEKYILESFKLTDSGKYNDAIGLLNAALVRFSDDDIILINYNIGFNYYLLKKYDDATSYFNTVINLYTTSKLSEAQKIDDKKFHTLSNIMIEKISIEKEELKDPYRAKEDIEKNKVLRGKKDR